MSGTKKLQKRGLSRKDELLPPRVAVSKGMNVAPGDNPVAPYIPTPHFENPNVRRQQFSDDPELRIQRLPFIGRTARHPLTRSVRATNVTRLFFSILFSWERVKKLTRSIYFVYKISICTIFRSLCCIFCWALSRTRVSYKKQTNKKLIPGF